MRTFRFRSAPEYYKRRNRREGFARWKRLFTHNRRELRELQKESLRFAKLVNMGPYKVDGRSLGAIVAESITSVLGKQQFASRFTPVKTLKR